MLVLVETAVPLEVVPFFDVAIELVAALLAEEVVDVVVDVPNETASTEIVTKDSARTT